MTTLKEWLNSNTITPDVSKYGFIDGQAGLGYIETLLKVRYGSLELASPDDTADLCEIALETNRPRFESEKSALDKTLADYLKTVDVTESETTDTTNNGTDSTTTSGNDSTTRKNNRTESPSNSQNTSKKERTFDSGSMTEVSSESVSNSGNIKTTDDGTDTTRTSGKEDITRTATGKTTRTATRSGFDVANIPADIKMILDLKRNNLYSDIAKTIAEYTTIPIFTY